MSTVAKPEIINPAGFVPPNALAFGELGADAAFVTHATPLPVRQDDAMLSLIERLNREGDPLGSSFEESAHTTFTPNPPSSPGIAAATGLPSGYPPPGRAWFIQTMMLGCTTPIVGRLLLGGSQWAGVGTLTNVDIGFQCGPNFPGIVETNTFLRSSDKPQWKAIYIKRWLDPSVGGTHHFTAGSIGWQLADAINFDARKVILMVGDSLWNGTGPSDVASCIPWKINRQYRQRGIDARYILKSYSGIRTGGHEILRQGGKYEFPRLDAIFYQVGTNDAQASIDPVDSLANVAAYIAWKQFRYPDASLVVFGPPPLADNDDETTLGALRAAIAAHVVGLADPKVLFCDLGEAFDRTWSANYSSADGVHPNDAGLAQIWEGGHAGFPGLQSWLATNLPTI